MRFLGWALVAASLASGQTLSPAWVAVSEGGQAEFNIPRRARFPSVNGLKNRVTRVLAECTLASGHAACQSRPAD